MKKILAAAVFFSVGTIVLAGNPSKEELEQEKLRLVKLGGEGRVAFVNAASADDELLQNAARKIGNTVLINTFVVQKGGWSVSDAKRYLGEMRANAAIFVVKDKAMPMSLIALEEKWGMANIEGLDDRDAVKEIIRVSTVVLGGAYSRYKASAMRPVFSKAELAEKAGESLTIDSLMAIFPNLKDMGIKQVEMLDYVEALEAGVAPPPANDVQRKIKAEYDAEQKAKGNK